MSEDAIGGMVNVIYSVLVVRWLTSLMIIQISFHYMNGMCCYDGRVFGV